MASRCGYTVRSKPSGSAGTLAAVCAQVHPSIMAERYARKMERFMAVERSKNLD